MISHAVRFGLGSRWDGSGRSLVSSLPEPGFLSSGPGAPGCRFVWAVTRVSDISIFEYGARLRVPRELATGTPIDRLRPLLNRIAAWPGRRLLFPRLARGRHAEAGSRLSPASRFEVSTGVDPGTSSPVAPAPDRAARRRHIQTGLSI